MIGTIGIWNNNNSGGVEREDKEWGDRISDSDGNEPNRDDIVYDVVVE